MSALLAHRLARQSALPERSAPPARSRGAAAGTPRFLQRAVSDDLPGSSPLEEKNAARALSPAATESAAEAEPAAETSETPSEAEPATDSICCTPDQTKPPAGFSFDIDQEIFLPEVCTPSGCVRVTIDSQWARPHAARHFRVTLGVLSSSGASRTIPRRFDVGHETQTFRSVGRCNSFRLRIQVISPSTSPNLTGTVRITSC